MQNEDKTSQNDELEVNANENDNSSTKGDEPQGESQDNRTYTEAELKERIEQERKERDKRWRDRIKKAQGDEEEGGESGTKDHSKKESVASDDVVLARLEARGVMDSDIQEYLITAAKREGTSPVQLLEDSYFKDRIAAMKKEKEQAAATPAPGNRTNRTDRSNDVDYLVQRVRDKGEYPKDPEMRRKVLQRLAGK